MTTEHHKLKTVSILGCGWFGMALAKKLIALSFSVKGSTTSPHKIEVLKQAGIIPYLLNFNHDNTAQDIDFFKTDILLICIPPKRNSAEFPYYPVKIKTILELAKNQSKQIIFISSTSIYGDTNQEVNEYTAPIPDTEAGKLILTSENLILAEKNTTVIRFAGLFGPERNPGRFFAGKTGIANGLAPVNLIHQTDAVNIASAVIEKEAFGEIYNACAPSHPTKQDFYTKAAKKSGFAEPQFILEKKEWKIVGSVNVPRFLGYEFEVNL